MTSKTDIATQVYQEHINSPRAAVVKAIAMALGTNNSNASTYYSKLAKSHPAPVVAVKTETDAEILSRITSRFDMLEKLAEGAIDGTIRSMICFGAPGVGKTYGIEKLLNSQSDVSFDIIKGSCSAPGLYIALFNARKGGVVTLDDCDSVFDDEATLNLMKAALDSTDKRTISWRKLSSWIDENLHEDDYEEGESVYPNSFEFKGSMILLTNIDMQAKVEKGAKMSAHFKALMSRSLYLDLTMKTNREILIRIKDVFVNAMAPQMNISKSETVEIFEYVNANADQMIDLSLRLMVHIVDIFKLGGDWKEMVEITKMKLV